ALETEVNRKLWETLRQLLIVASSTFALALLIALSLAWSLSRPIGGLVRAARAIGQGRLDYENPAADRSDELGFLAREMDMMARRLKELDDLKDQFVST